MGASNDNPTSTGNSSGNGSGSNANGGKPSGGTGSKSGSKERDLIAGAVRQASPRIKPILPPRDMLPADAFPGYELVREIHRGGQGVVYLAIQKSTNRKVAIKVIKEGPFSGTKERARFEREVHILGALNHPNIVAIHDSGQVQGLSFVVMDYIAGQPLDAYLASTERSIGDILKLFVTICSAVNEAHLRGVVHRDLKPGNILVDGNGQPKILDFGLAKMSTPESSDAKGAAAMMTMTGQFIGSLPWASPEQAGGTPDLVDIRTDVYSLGVILYQMLTGKFPYQVIGNMRDVLENILRAEPARPSTVRRQINDEVETIVLKCLSKERDRRYQSAGELGRDLSRYLSGQPIEAKRDSGWYVITKTLRRHRIAVGVAAGFVVMIVLFGSIMTVLYGVAESAREVAANRLKEVEAEREAKERERKTADENFNAVRGLARAFLFEFNDKVENLRGSTAAREEILVRAKEYLDKLEPRAGDDLDLRRELADAHEKVGDIKAGLYEPNRGDSRGGAAEYAKAKAIREEILAAHPNDARSHTDTARIATRMGRSLERARKFADAVSEYEKSIALFDQAIGLTRDERERAEREAMKQGAALDLVGALTRLAETSRTEDERRVHAERAERELTPADSYWRARLRANASDVSAARWVGVCADKRAKLLAAQARSAGREMRRLRDAGETNGAAAKLSDSLSLYARSREEASSAASEFERLSDEQSANAQLRRDLFLALHNIGVADMDSALLLKSAAEFPSGWQRNDETVAKHEAQVRAFEAALSLPHSIQQESESRHAAALSQFQRATAVTEALSSADEANIEAIRDLYFCLNKVGNQQRSLGRLDEAEATYKRSLNLRQDLFKTDPTHMHRKDVGLGANKYGYILIDLADRESATRAERIVRLEAAEQSLKTAMEHFGRLRDAGVLAEDSEEITDTRRILERCREKLKAARG